jgi:hypothetical protein
MSQEIQNYQAAKRGGKEGEKRGKRSKFDGKTPPMH